VGIWRQACEYAITPILKDAGFKLPPEALYADRFRDQSAEQIHAVLFREQPPKSPSGGAGQHEPTAGLTSR